MESLACLKPLFSIYWIRSSYILFHFDNMCNITLLYRTENHYMKTHLQYIERIYRCMKLIYNRNRSINWETTVY